MQEEQQVITSADVGTLVVGDAPAKPVEKFPELRATFDKLRAEKAAIQERSAPLHKRYDELAAKIAPLADEQRAVAKQFHAIERPRLAEIDTQLSHLARAMGGRRMSDG